MINQPLRISASQPLKRAISLFVLAGCLTLNAGPIFAAQTLPALEAAPAPVNKDLAMRGQISISRAVDIASEKEKVSLNMRDASIRDVLNMLAKQGNFNLVLDDSINGTLTVDIKNVSINKALEYIFTVSDFSYTKDGNTLIVASSNEADQKNLAAQTFKAIPVQYKNASDVAGQLNSTLFSVKRPNGTKKAVVAFDGNSNSLLVMGTAADIKMVGDFLREMDTPRNRKVYHVRHNTPQYVASIIAANFFTPAASGVATTATTGAAAPAAAAPAAAAPAAAATNVNPSPAPTVLNVGGVTLIGESLSGTLTVMGTDEQLALVDSIFDQVDVRRPQVAIEMSMVEMSSDDKKQFIPNMNALQYGEFSLGLFPSTADGSNQFGWTQGVTNATRGSVLNNLLPLKNYSFNHLFTTGRVKLLANPTVVAMDGQPATINVTDQIATITQTVTAAVPPLVATTIVTNPVGISMTVTPSIFNDGTVGLNLTPNLSIPGLPVSVTDGAGHITASTTLIKTRTVTMTGVRVQDGQTLVIGGLLNNSDTDALNKTPGLSDLPLVGGLMKSHIGAKSKDELVILVTPHILKDDGVPYFQDPPQTSSSFSSPNQGMVKPVSLPKFIGGDDVQSLNTAGSNFFPWNKINRKKAGQAPPTPEANPATSSSIQPAQPAQASTTAHSDAVYQGKPELIAPPAEPLSPTTQHEQPAAQKPKHVELLEPKRNELNSMDEVIKK